MFENYTDEQLEKVFWLVEAVADYLNSDMVNTVTQDVEDIMDAGVSPDDAVRLLLASCAGLDCLDEDVFKFSKYYNVAVKQLDKNVYLNNPYYKRIKFGNEISGNCLLTTEKYKKYEPFIYDDLYMHFDGTLIPKVGFFNSEFAYPAVKENGRVWMSVCPNEINTMQEPIDKATGNVLALGLGLGYFPYMCSLKKEVKSITIIEQNDKIIDLFARFILPQFEFKDKINVIKADAFTYMEYPTDDTFNTVFCDIWHDVSDGVDSYLKLKKYEKNFPNAQFFYWIEKSMKYYI